MPSLNLRSAAWLVAYTLGSVRYGGLVVPVGVVAWLVGLPYWMIVAAVVLLVFAVAGEIFSSVVNGLAHVNEQQMVAQVYNEMEWYANHGSEAGEEASPEEGRSSGQG